MPVKLSLGLEQSLIILTDSCLASSANLAGWDLTMEAHKFSALSGFAALAYTYDLSNISQSMRVLYGSDSTPAKHRWISSKSQVVLSSSRSSISSSSPFPLYSYFWIFMFLLFCFILFYFFFYFIHICFSFSPPFLHLVVASFSGATSPHSSTQLDFSPPSSLPHAALTYQLANKLTENQSLPTPFPI